MTEVEVEKILALPEVCVVPRACFIGKRDRYRSIQDKDRPRLASSNMHKDVRSVLELASYNRRFVRNFALLASLMNALLTKGGKFS